MKIALAWQATAAEIARMQLALPDACHVVGPDAHPYVDRFTCEPEDLRKIARDAEVIVGWHIPDEAVEAAPRLRLIVYFHAGCDYLNLPLLRARNVEVVNAAGANTIAVAEHAMALVLGLAKRLIYHHRAASNVEWNRSEETYSVELAGETMAIVGLGHIGQALARRAKGFDMRVLGVKRNPAAGGSGADEVVAPDRLLDVLPPARFVVLTVPLMPDTVHVIDERELRAMRQDAFLVNMSRGRLVREGALHRALTEGWIAGYAADVWFDYADTQPSGYHYNMPSRLGIHRLPNVLATGNVGSYAKGVRERLLDHAAKNIAAFARGERPSSLIDSVRGY